MARKKYEPRPLKIYLFEDNPEALDKAGLQYMKGQCQVVLDLLRRHNGPWDSEILAKSIEKHPKYYSRSNMRDPKEVAYYFIGRLKKAGCIKTFDTLGDYECYINTISSE